MKRKPLPGDEQEFLEPLMEPYYELTDAWMNAWVQPLATWRQFVGGQWQQWLDAFAQLPNPWLPALAAGREGQPPAIDFFLRWLQLTVGESAPSRSSAQADAAQAASASVATPAPTQPKKTATVKRAPRKPAAKKPQGAVASEAEAAKKTVASDKSQAKRASAAPAAKAAPARRAVAKKAAVPASAGTKARAPAKPADAAKSAARGGTRAKKTVGGA